MFGSSERVFSSVRAARGAGQVGWHSVLAGLVGLRGRARAPPTTKIGNRGLTGLALNVCVFGCVWVWVGSNTNWTGVVGCACVIYVDAKGRQTHNHVFWYLTIFAFGSDYFGSTSGAFGQVREIRIEPSTRFWQVWVLGARSVVSTGRSGRFV